MNAPPSIRIVIHWTDPEGRSRIAMRRVTDPKAAHRAACMRARLAQRQHAKALCLGDQLDELDDRIAAAPTDHLERERARLAGAVSRALTAAQVNVALSTRFADARDALLDRDPGLPFNPLPTEL